MIIEKSGGEKVAHRFFEFIQTDVQVPLFLFERLTLLIAQRDIVLNEIEKESWTQSHVSSLTFLESLDGGIDGKVNVNERVDDMCGRGT